MLRGETPEFSLEYPCHSPTEKRWFRMMVTHAGLAPASGAVVMHVNVTERRLAEEAMHEQEAVQRSMAEQLTNETRRLYQSQAVANVGSWETNVTTLDVIWTPEAFRIFETTPEQFQPTHAGFLEFVHPDDRKKVGDAFARSLGQPGSFSVEHRLLLLGGKIKHVEERWHNFNDAAGKPLRVVGTCQDITERKQAEDALRASEEQFRLLVNLAPVGVYLADEQGRCTYVNPKWCEMAGMSMADALGDGWRRGIHPENRDTVLSSWNRMVESDGRWGQEYRFQTPDGEVTWVYGVVASRRNAAGKIVGYIGINTDITERRQTEAKRDEIERFFHAIADSIPGMVGYWDFDLRNRFANRAYLEWFGRSEPEMMGITMQELMGEELFRKNEPHIRAVLRGEIQQFERDLKKPDGQVGYLWAQYIPHRIEGKMVGFFAMVTDITAVKVAEAHSRASDQQLREVIDSIDAIIWEADAITFQFESVSSNAERLLGYATTDWLMPNFWADHIHPEDRDHAVQHCVECTGRLDNYVLEYRFIAKDGRVVWLRDDVRVVAEDGKPHWLRGLMFDITATRAMEAQLRQSQKMEAVGTLAGGIAHDLNNILSPTLLIAPMLKDKLPDAQSLELLTMIEEGARRGAKIISQLLTFSRGAEGKRGPVQVRHELKAMVAIIRETFPRDITVSEKLPADLWPVIADATQIHQVVLNLCVNARDAMRSGGKITLAAENVNIVEPSTAINEPTKPGPYVRLTISDTGQGIPRENLERIFEPFFTTKEIGQGTGLGLSTVLGIVRSHGGFILVDSELGAGSSFKVLLPADQNAVATVVGPKSSTPVGRQELILIVDDEPAIRHTLSLALKKNNYRVLTAESGRGAMDLFEANRESVRLLLTDIMMPGMYGTTLIRLLREQAPQLRVIAATGLHDENRREELAAMGVTNILSKPCLVDDVLEAVSRELAAQA